MGKLLIFILGAMFGGTIGAGCMCLMYMCGLSHKKSAKKERSWSEKKTEQDPGQGEGPNID